MDFKNQIKQLGERVVKLKDSLWTEEATKNAFIMPFIQILGYDVFNPLEVVPEFISDIWIKKWEKIDYAILKDWKPTILVECKHWKENLNLHDGQLFRYFHVSEAKFALLTNGVEYRFYSDLVSANKMDDKPFLEFDITNISESQLEELIKFHKNNFDIDNITTTASELKYSIELRKILLKEISNPSLDFVKYFAKQVYHSVITQKVSDHFTELLKNTIQQFITDTVTERLKLALDKESKVNKEEIVDKNIENDKIITTEEELESFMIVKAILRQKIDSSRIFYRDAQTYFAILLDNNNRKTICRLYLNWWKKYLVILDENKKEIKNEINTLDDIFNYSDLLYKTLNLIDIK